MANLTKTKQWKKVTKEVKARPPVAPFPTEKAKEIPKELQSPPITEQLSNDFDETCERLGLGGQFKMSSIIVQIRQKKEVNGN